MKVSEMIRVGATHERQAQAGVHVTNVEWVSDQFPGDDNDPDAAAQVYLEFSLSGEQVAKLLGKQMRVLDEALKKLQSKEALAALSHSSQTEREILQAAKAPIMKLLTQDARENFERGVKNVKMDIADRSDVWEAKVNAAKKQIDFTIEVDVLWYWA